MLKYMVLNYLERCIHVKVHHINLHLFQQDLNFQKKFPRVQLMGEKASTSNFRHFKETFTRKFRERWVKPSFKLCAGRKAFGIS